MKKFGLFLLMLVLLLTLTSCSGDQKATLQPLAVKEEAYWLSVSPKGSYLLGWKEADGEGAFLLYDVKAANTIPLTIDTAGDTYGELEYLKMCRLPKWEPKVVWAADESRFVLMSGRVVRQLDFRWDLLLGDTRSHTLGLAETWADGAIHQACFDEAGKLYFSYIGKDYLDSHGSNSILMVFDPATGETTPLMANDRMSDSGSSNAFQISGEMYAIGNGQLLQFGVCEGTWFMRICKENNGEWMRVLKQLGGIQPNGLKTQYAAGLLTLSWVDSETGRNGLRAYRFTDGQPEQVFSEDHTAAAQVIPSPDGLSLLRIAEKDGQYQLLLGAADGRGKTDNVLPETLQGEQAALQMIGSGNAAFQPGLLWGGDVLLLGTEAGAVPYRIQ